MEAVAALREQATGTGNAGSSGYADVTWRYRHQREALALAEPWAALCKTFQVLTSEAEEWANAGIPLDIAYPVSEIVTSAIHLAVAEGDASVQQSLAAFAWRVACGWEAVLAGDIDDIAEHDTRG